MTITVHVKMINGEPHLDAVCMGLLMGVEPDAVRALPVQDGASLIPREWTKRGRRRAKEAAAHTGTNTMLDSLRYWARKEHNADLNVVYQ